MLLNLLPNYLQNIKDYRELFDAVDIVLNVLESDCNQVQNNMYIQACDDATILMYEQLLGIVAKNSDTIEFRRQRVFERLIELPPFSINALKIRLNKFIGINSYILEVRPANYYVSLLLKLDYNACMLVYNEIVYIMQTYLPAHLYYEIFVAGSHKVLQSYQHIELQPYKHEEISKLQINGG